MTQHLNANTIEIASMARSLGWDKFNLFIYNFPRSDDPSDEKELTVWMECRDLDTHFEDNEFFLQINLFNLNELNSNTFLMCVYAMRYQMCTGWRPFVVSATDEERNREVARLSPFFNLSHFTSEENRELYKRKFPHSAGYTWDKIQKEGVPKL